MPDPMAKWTPTPDWSAARLTRPDFTALRVDLRQTLLSGDLQAALAETCPDARSVGLWEIAGGARAAIRIARDRALLVSSEPLQAAPGWRSGYAATDAGDAYAVLQISGPGLRALAAEGCSADVDAGGPSAAALFAGVPALLYRIAEQEARLHVEAALAPYVWRWLETR